MNDDELGWLGGGDEESEKQPTPGEGAGEEFQDALNWLAASEDAEEPAAPAPAAGAPEPDGLGWLEGGDEEAAPAVVDDDEDEDDKNNSIFSTALDDFFEDMEETPEPEVQAPAEADQTIVTTRKKRKRRSQDEHKIDRVINTLVRYLTRKDPVRESQLDTIFRLTVGKIVDPISAEVIVVYFLDEGGDAHFAHLFYSRSLFRNHPGLEEKFSKSLESLGQLKIPAGAGIIGKALAGHKSITSLDAGNDPAFLNHLGKATGYGVKTMLTVPILDKVERGEGKDPDYFLYGAVQIMNKDPNSGEEFFSYQDLKLVENIGAYLGRLIHLVREPDLKRGEEEIANYYALMAKTEVVDPTDEATFEWDPRLWGLVGHEVVQKYEILPIKMMSGKGVQIVMANPMDMTRRSGFEAATDLRIEECFVALEGKIREVIEKVLNVQPAAEVDDSEMASILNILDEENPDAVAKAKKGKKDEEEEEEDTDTGLMKLVNSIIEQAYVRGVSDIHIEPDPERDLMVRYRIDGVCQKFTTVPRRFARAIISRLKIMSDLDIAERRKPQDGKIKFKKYGKLDIELRVATLPTVGAQEDCVMRILAASKPMPLDNMGFMQENLDRFKTAITQPYGLCLVVGPTGSGKTTTLHSALGFINKPETKIWTAEDPVEITQYGLRQVQMQPKIGLTFATAMRAFLRADPDVIMIGEMRDHETAEAGIEASLTGHMVFSTLHTNSAPETVIRLLDMGIDPYSFGDSLLGVCAQRLLRRLCKCKRPAEVTPEILAAFKKEFNYDTTWDALKLEEEVELFERGSCTKCGESGYKGRMGIHEFMQNSDDLRALIYASAKVSELRTMALEEGMTTLKQDGIRKVLKGGTDIFEVRRVCIK